MRAADEAERLVPPGYGTHVTAPRPGGRLRLDDDPRSGANSALNLIPPIGWRGTVEEARRY